MLNFSCGFSRYKNNCIRPTSPSKTDQRILNSEKLKARCQGLARIENKAEPGSRACIGQSKQLVYLFALTCLRSTCSPHRRSPPPWSLECGPTSSLCRQNPQNLTALTPPIALHVSGQSHKLDLAVESQRCHVFKHGHRTTDAIIN